MRSTFTVSIYQHAPGIDKFLLVARVYCHSASEALSQGAHYASLYEEEGFPIIVKIKNPSTKGE
jgi:hypothetical protein